MSDHVYSIGRDGSYRYVLDIDDCIEQAMTMANRSRKEATIIRFRWRRGGKPLRVLSRACAGDNAPEVLVPQLEVSHLAYVRMIGVVGRSIADDSAVGERPEALPANHPHSEAQEQT
jgi:hypothetical protein